MESIETDRAAIGYHLSFRSVDERNVARTPAELRLASRLLFHHGAPRGLVAFRVADPDVHVFVAGRRAMADRLARHVQWALKRSLRISVPFERARIRPLVDLRHLFNSLRGVFRKEQHHGIDLDPAHDGSSLPDLLGMRIIEGTSVVALRLRSLLPRLARATLFEWLGFDSLRWGRPDLRLLADAAAAARGLPSLAGLSRAHHEARLGAVHLFGQAPASDVGSLLGVGARTIERLRVQHVPPAVVTATARQLHLRTLLRRREEPDRPTTDLSSDRC